MEIDIQRDEYMGVAVLAVNVCLIMKARWDHFLQLSSHGHGHCDALSSECHAINESLPLHTEHLLLQRRTVECQQCSSSAVAEVQNRSILQFYV